MSQREIILVSMQQRDLRILQSWFDDAELKKRLGGLLPLQRYFDYVQSEPNYFAWTAMEGETSIGALFLQVQTHEPTSFGFLVDPAVRSCGYGRSLLRKLMVQPEVARIEKWRVGVESDNLASQRCMQAVGFMLESDVEDEDGFLQYTFDQSKHA